MTMGKKKNVAMGLVAGAIALALTLNAARVEAQSPSDFVGKWTIAFDGPAGGGPGGPGGPRPGGGIPGGGGMRGGPTVLDISMEADKLVATITGGMGARGNADPRSISDVEIVDGALLLTYTVNGQGGNAAPVTLKLTPGEAATKVEMDIAGRFQRTGTATKE